MLRPHAALSVHLSRRTASPLPRAGRIATLTRHFASSSRVAAQVQEDVAHDAQSSPTDEPQKLGKRARKAIEARQRQEQERAAKEAEASVRAQTEEPAAAEAAEGKGSDDSANAAIAGSPTILRVKHVISGPDAAPPSQQVDQWRSNLKNQDGSNPTAGWSGSLFRSHISSLLSGFGTAPDTRQLQESGLPGAVPASTSAPATSSSAAVKSTSKKGSSSSSPFMTKSERMESQARVIFQAIREARERGIVDEDESFFYPYPEGVPPKDIDGKDVVWLNLGPDPEAWGREIPQVKDRWLEALSLGLAKEIPGRTLTSETADGEHAEEAVAEDEFAFDDLVEDFDLEDHERLEQLGDSIVNMSSRLLAYHSYPDVNEGSLTRLSNYPTQNNFLALLFQECGLAARRDELRRELCRARPSDDDDEPVTDDATPTKRQVKKDGEAAQTDEEKAKLPLLIKRDADMFEAYAAAVFLSHGNDFNVVHNWLCQLFRPFQDQAYRFMVQRSEALARLQANRAAAATAAAQAAASATAAEKVHSKADTSSSPTNLTADGLGIRSATVDPSSVPFSSLFPDFGRGSDRSHIPAYALTNAGEAFITDEFLTVAARARRQREERLREELRLQDQQELMNMGWFRKGFLNLRTEFRQYVLGKDVAREHEARIRQKVNEQRGMSEKDRQRLRAKERSAAGVSIKSTGSRTKTKVSEVDVE
ncbi:conserved hypothetical protein [Sporisorium reilianum SRZ2]|uniref:RNase III domain-containing protein n=1 Tax=Sporisorium reilianum (strain SRZ2) TaxID=999809 RepID=E6ZZR6_SPORE|nr:conserved hypothetical protein [Sporisorium reilianum SRZ2]